MIVIVSHIGQLRESAIFLLYCTITFAFHVLHERYQETQVTVDMLTSERWLVNHVGVHRSKAADGFASSHVTHVWSLSGPRGRICSTLRSNIYLRSNSYIFNCFQCRNPRNKIAVMGKCWKEMGIITQFEPLIIFYIINTIIYSAKWQA